MSRLPGWLWGTGRRRATNRSRDEPAHPHPAPREEVPARAPTLGQPRTCARTDRQTLGTTGVVPKNHGLDEQSSRSLQPAGPGGSHLQSREDSVRGSPRPAHAAQAAGRGGARGGVGREGAGNRGGPWVQIPTLLPPGRVTSEKSPNLSEFRFLHLSNNNSSTYHQGRRGIPETVRGEQTANYDRSTSV